MYTEMLTTSDVNNVQICISCYIVCNLLKNFLTVITHYLYVHVQSISDFLSRGQFMDASLPPPPSPALTINVYVALHIHIIDKNEGLLLSTHRGQRCQVVVHDIVCTTTVASSPCSPSFWTLHEKSGQSWYLKSCVWPCLWRTLEAYLYRRGVCQRSLRFWALSLPTVNK